MALWRDKLAGDWKFQEYLRDGTIVRGNITDRPNYKRSRDIPRWRVKELYNEKLNEIYSGNFVSKTITFKDFMEKYYIPKELSHRTGYIRVEKYKAKMLIDFFGKKSLDKFSDFDIARLRSMRKESGISDNTIKKDIYLLTNTIRYAIKWGFLGKYPFSPINIKVQQKPPVFFKSLIEINDFLSHVGIYYIKDFCIICLNLGLRKSEALSLKWSDINLNSRKVTIAETKNYTLRVIPINDALFNHFRQMKRFGEFAISRKNGSRYTRIDDAFKAVAKASGYKVTPHSLRHTFATHHLQAGMSIKTLQYYMGHKRLEQTEHYLHFIEQDEHKVINNFQISAVSTQILHKKITQSKISSSKKKAKTPINKKGMREGRVELPHLAVLDPKSSASASSATLAFQKDEHFTTFY